MSVVKATTGTIAARRSVCQSLVCAAVGCVIGLLLVDTWLVQGLVVPMIVASGSMAPVLCGPRQEWVCQGCGESFACGLESLPAPGHAAVCPFCRAPNDAAGGVARAGDRVVVDRAAYLMYRPRRFEMVALRSPADPWMLCVKRVVGLPGEQVRIDAGDVWANGQIVRKSPDREREMAVSVYRAPQMSGNRDAANGAFERWHASTGGWVCEHGAFTYLAPAPRVAAQVHHGLLKPGATLALGAMPAPRGHAESPPIDWLVYAGPITDESPYDQSESLALRDVSDVMLRCRLTSGSQGEFLIRATSRADQFLLRLDLATRQATLEHNGRRILQGDASMLAPRKATSLEWSIVDRQVRFALDGRDLIKCAYVPSPRRADRTPASLAIGSRAADVEIQDLRVLRDVYYASSSRGAAFERTLGPHEYLVLGDNSAHSEDGRDWSAWGGVSSKFIVGRALHW